MPYNGRMEQQHDTTTEAPERIPAQSPISTPPSPLRRGWSELRAMHETQRVYILGEFTKVRDLLPLLMKRRNGGKWTKEERKALMRDLRAVSNLSPYLIPLIMPGGFLLLPLFAWWLDRRRRGRKDEHAE